MDTHPSANPVKHLFSRCSLARVIITGLRGSSSWMGTLRVFVVPVHHDYDRIVCFSRPDCPSIHPIHLFPQSVKNVLYPIAGTVNSRLDILRTYLKSSDTSLMFINSTTSTN